MLTPTIDKKAIELINTISIAIISIVLMFALTQRTNQLAFSILSILYGCLILYINQTNNRTVKTKQTIPQIKNVIWVVDIILT